MPLDYAPIPSDPHPAKDQLAFDQLVDNLTSVVDRMCNLHARDVPRSLVNKQTHFVTDSQRVTLLKKELIKRLGDTLP